ncbi:MAG: mannose-6-phosphate isomerase [Frankiales bacterium]|nr:mannose-6-phosphate isomerase [Frankiales bacterium]
MTPVDLGRSPILELDSVIRPYAWGSRDFIPRLLGRPATDQPAAELWLGAHPGAPSRIPVLNDDLAGVIAADPVGALGRSVADSSDGRLPFLLKVLAAESPLSLQVHPTREQAQAGFIAENERGVPLDAPERNYVDTNHKPELICALTEFDALIGFRPVAETAQLLHELIERGAHRLDGYPSRLLAEGGLREVVTGLLALPDAARPQLLASVLPAAQALADATNSHPDAVDLAWSAECAWAVRLAEDFPGDIGVVLALLLNLVRLHPGQAAFLPAGQVHAYLHGAGIELMASSDNVLRCGLTVKHIDVPELLRIVDFTPTSGELVHPETTGALTRFPVPVPDFELTLLGLRADQHAELPAAGPRILICTSGAVRLRSTGGADRDHELPQGHSVFVAAGTAVRVLGAGDVFVASAGSET